MPPLLPLHALTAKPTTTAAPPFTSRTNYGVLLLDVIVSARSVLSTMGGYSLAALGPNTSYSFKNTVKLFLLAPLLLLLIITRFQITDGKFSQAYFTLVSQ